MRLTQNFTLAGFYTAERLGIHNPPSERVIERMPRQEELGVNVVGFDQRLAGRDRGWFLYGPDNRLQHDIAGTLGNGSWAISSAPMARMPA